MKKLAPFLKLTHYRPVGFVGRQHELLVLKGKLAEAQVGHPQVVYIETDAGAGKSMLLSQFLVSVSGPVVLVVGVRLVDTLDRLQASGQTVLVAIDDLQWIDRPSSRALLFALRLGASEVAALISGTRGHGPPRKSSRR